MWEANFCWQSPLALAYTRGHFSALVGSGNVHGSHDQGIYLPLVDNQGHMLPVHYLTEQEVTVVMIITNRSGVRTVC